MFNTFSDSEVNQNINMLRKFLLKIEQDHTLISDHHLRVIIDGQAFVSEPSKQPSIEFSFELSSDQNPEIAIEVIRDKELFFTQVPLGKFNIQQVYSSPKKYLSYKPDGGSSLAKRFFYVCVSATQMKIEKVKNLESGFRQITLVSKTIDDKFKTDHYIASAEQKLVKKDHYGKSLSDKIEAKMGRVLVHLLGKMISSAQDVPEPSPPLCQITKLTFNPQQQAAEYSYYDFYPGNIVKTIPEYDSIDLNARFLNSNECCQLPNGDYVLAGGSSIDNVVKYKHLMVLCPKLRRTFIIDTLPHYRKGHTVKYFDGKIYIIGGRINQETVFSKTVWSYSIQKRTWQEKSSLINNYEVSQKDFLEVFGGKKYLFVMMKKNFAMECLNLADMSSSWKRIDEPKSIKTFSNLILIKEDEHCAYLLLQDFMNEHIFHLVSFNYETFEFKSLKTATLPNEVNFRYFFRSSDFIYFLPESALTYACMNLTKAISAPELKDAVETFANSKIGLAVSELITAKRDFATLFLESRYRMETNFKNEYYCVNSSGVFTISTNGTNAGLMAIDFGYQPFKKQTKLSSKIEGVPFHTASILSLLDGTLFVNYWQKTNDCWIGKTIFYSQEGFVKAQANSICRFNSELIQHKEYIYMIGGTHKNSEVGIDVIEVYDLMLGKWIEPITIPRKLTRTRSFVKNEKLSILFDLDSNIKMITVDLATQRYISEQDLNLTLENLNAEKPISVTFLNQKYVLIAFTNQDSATSIILYDTFEETKATYSIALLFSTLDVNLIEDFVILVVEEEGVKKIKKKEKDLLIEFIINNQQIDFQTLEIKTDSFGDHNHLRIVPILNQVDFFLPFNYFKYNRNKNARDQPTQYWSVNSKGIFNWDATANSLQRLGTVDKPTDLPLKASACTYKNNLFISGGLIKEKSRFVSTNTVTIISMMNPRMLTHSYMNRTRFGHVMLTHNDKLYAIGGYENPSKTQVLDQVEFFNHEREEWLFLQEMNYKRAEFSAVSMLNHIVVFFGASNGKVLNSVEAYSSDEADRWHVLKNFPTNIFLKNHQVQAINFRSVLIFGGVDENEKPNFDFYSVSFENLLHGAPNVSKLASRLPAVLLNPFSHYEGKELTIFGDKMYKFKYIHNQKLNFHFTETQEYNYQNYLDDFNGALDVGVAYYAPYKTNLHASTRFQEFNNEFKYLYIFGIENIPQIYRINLATLSWEILPSPPEFIFQDYACAVSTPEGCFLVAGGLDGKSSRISKNAYRLFYDEAKKKFECIQLCDMINARYTFTGTYLENYIYVIGGRQLGSVK